MKACLFASGIAAIVFWCMVVNPSEVYMPFVDIWNYLLDALGGKL
jgi:hypothetical protein